MQTNDTLECKILSENEHRAMNFLWPSVFGRNIQREPVRAVDTREEYHWSHACSLQANMHGNQWHPRV
jgi:hypothetical protein